VTLTALARELAIGDRVHVLPAVPVEALISWTSGADLGVSLLQDTCDNHRLALPNKVFEYLAAGIPVVTSDLPELRRLVLGHGLGWVAPPGDVAALCNALGTALAHSSDLELRDRLLTAREQLRWTHEGERLTALYRSLSRAPADRVRATYASYGASTRKQRDWSRDAPGRSPDSRGARGGAPRGRA
jgi:glycosyltransferase involved in cell wall biosynthesis